MIEKIFLIAGITFKEGLRDRALHGILFIALVSCILYVTVVPLFAFEHGKVMLDIGFASLTIAGLAIIIFLGISLLTEDIHRRTVCMIISRPISRIQYVIGKYLGLSYIVFVSLVIITTLGILSGSIAYTFIPDMEIPRNFSWSVFFAGILFNYLSLLIILAVAFLFTVITTNSYLSMIFTFCIYIIGHSLETIVKVLTIGDFVQVSPFYLKVMKLLMWVFPNLKAMNLKVSIAYGLPLSSSYFIWSGVYGIFYIFIILYLTAAIFNRREIK